MSRSLARKIATISALTAWAVLGSTRARAEDALGDKRVTQVSVQKNDIAGAVLALALDTGVPIGVEVLAGPGEEFDVTAAGSTLGTELNKLVRNDPRYQWKQIGKAIDIFPKDEPDFVFDVPVDHFELKDGFPAQMIQELLRDPAVAAHLAKAKVTAGTWVAGSASRQRASVNIEKATFRRALNDIVVAVGRSGWTAFHQRQADVDYLWFQLW
jgi:hypothetical protein